MNWKTEQARTHTVYRTAEHGYKKKKKKKKWGDT
jgi:hypothetical protein